MSAKTSPADHLARQRALIWQALATLGRSQAVCVESLALLSRTQDTIIQARDQLHRSDTPLPGFDTGSNVSTLSNSASWRSLGS